MTKERKNHNVNGKKIVFHGFLTKCPFKTFLMAVPLGPYIPPRVIGRQKFKNSNFFSLRHSNKKNIFLRLITTIITNI